MGLFKPTISDDVCAFPFFSSSTARWPPRQVGRLESAHLNPAMLKLASTNYLHTQRTRSPIGKREKNITYTCKMVHYSTITARNMIICHSIKSVVHYRMTIPSQCNTLSPKHFRIFCCWHFNDSGLQLCHTACVVAATFLILQLV